MYCLRLIAHFTIFGTSIHLASMLFDAKTTTINECPSFS
jgi:hypothetical protein